MNKAVVDHPALTTQLDQLLILTAHPTSRNLVLVIGPTGGGKSTLLRQLKTKINSIYLQLESPATGAFNFQVLHRAALIAMNAPLVDRTRPIVYREVDGVRIPTLLVEREISALRGDGLKTRFYNEIDRRKVRALILDEAKALFKIGRPKNDVDRLERLKEQGDLVKDMANATNSTVVLGGAYDFFDLSISSGQNARRTVIVHVKPYDNTPHGIQGFATAITGLLCHLPCHHSIDPVAAATELFLQGLACVGTGAGILAEAFRESIVTGKPLDMALVRKYYYPAAALKKMRSEMEEGMRRVDALVALEDLADPERSGGADSAPGAVKAEGGNKTPAPRLKPGETAPSHMADQTKGVVNCMGNTLVHTRLLPPRAIPPMDGPQRIALHSLFRVVCEANQLTVNDVVNAFHNEILGTDRVPFSRVFIYLQLSDAGSLQSHRLVAFLESATGMRNLLGCTLAEVSGRSDGTRLLTGKTRKWCPHCYSQDILDNWPPYDRLLWSIDIATHCPIHHVRLESECGQCNLKFATHPRSFDISGFCPACQSWLGRRANPIAQLTSEDDRYDHWCSTVLAELIGNTSIFVTKYIGGNR